MSREYIEEIHPRGFKIRYAILKDLFSGQSAFQKVDVVETASHGKMLFNDELAMVSELDEFIYHDMITHVPLFAHPCPKRVLVIGGGDGGTAREVLRHGTVEHCDMVEIDPMVVEACRAHIPATAQGMKSDPRFNLIIGDGVKYVAETKEKYDVVLVDSTDPIGPAQPLFGIDFYKDVSNCLSDSGIVVSQGESPFYNGDLQSALASILAKCFPVVSYFNFTNMTYPGGLWSFSFASKKHAAIPGDLAERVSKSNLKFRYYTADVHRGAFALPQFQLDNLQAFLRS